jgi:hypothetical protein
MRKVCTPMATGIWMVFRGAVNYTIACDWSTNCMGRCLAPIGTASYDRLWLVSCMRRCLAPIGELRGALFSVKRLLGSSNWRKGLSIFEDNILRLSVFNPYEKRNANTVSSLWLWRQSDSSETYDISKNKTNIFHNLHLCFPISV